MANVKVNTQTMNDWCTKLNTINQEAIGLLTTMDNDLKAIESYWEGTSAQTTVAANHTLISKASEHHTNMKEVANFLIKVSEVMNNE